MKGTSGCISSLLNLDTLSAKRKKSLHQRLQSTKQGKNLRVPGKTKTIIRSKYSHGQKEKIPDEPQEKQPPLLPSSGAHRWCSRIFLQNNW
jgi:hypothetical protein